MSITRPSLRPDTLLYIYYIQGVVPDDPSLPSGIYIGNWVEDGFSFLFFTEPAQQEVDKIVGHYPGLEFIDCYEMTYGQWQGGTVEPVRIGRFIFNPPWIKASPQENDISITLDAGVVFGNGTHPTTQACLEAIEISCAGQKVQTALDLGSGTGVLSLAAAKLGCERILAVDYNYLAAQTTRRNAVINGLDQIIISINGRAEDYTCIPSDLMVANIHYDVMKDVIRTPGFLKQKWFILSGLLRTEIDRINEYLATQPVLILKRWNSDGVWHTILGITNR
jgi:ribosomal protein L11 methyltransferase